MTLANVQQSPEHGERVARSQAERAVSVARRATAFPSTWGPRTSEVTRIGKPYALRELRSFLNAVAVAVPSASLLELAAEVDAELPLRDAQLETMRPPCPGCARCSSRRRATAVRPPPKRGAAAR